MSAEYAFTFRLEDGHLIFDNEFDADLFESALIDFVHRGYFEPKNIGNDGRLTYGLTQLGRGHINDIIVIR